MARTPWKMYLWSSKFAWQMLLWILWNDLKIWNLNFILVQNVTKKKFEQKILKNGVQMSMKEFSVFKHVSI